MADIDLAAIRARLTELRDKRDRDRPCCCVCGSPLVFVRERDRWKEYVCSEIVSGPPQPAPLPDSVTAHHQKSLYHEDASIPLRLDECYALLDALNAAEARGRGLEAELTRAREVFAPLMSVKSGLRNFLEHDSHNRQCVHLALDSLNYALALHSGGDGWTRVEDGLPKLADELVIVHIAFPHVGHLVYLGYYDRGGLQWIDPQGRDFRPGRITHWRPLPPPPQEGL